MRILASYFYNEEGESILRQRLQQTFDNHPIDDPTLTQFIATAEKPDQALKYVRDYSYLTPDLCEQIIYPMFQLFLALERSARRPSDIEGSAVPLLFGELLDVLLARESADKEAMANINDGGVKGNSGRVEHKGTVISTKETFFEPLTATKASESI